MATNAGALLFFLPHGSLLWGVGLVLGAANMAGGYLGARTAVKQGSRFVRIVFLAVVAALIIKLAPTSGRKTSPDSSARAQARTAAGHRRGTARVACSIPRPYRTP